MHTYTYHFNPENKSDLSFDEFKEDFSNFYIKKCPPVINPADGDYRQEVKIELKTFEDAFLMYHFIDDHCEDMMDILPLIFTGFVFDESIEMEYKELKKAAFYDAIQGFYKQVEERNTARGKSFARRFKEFEEHRPFQEVGGGIFNPGLFSGQHDVNEMFDIHSPQAADKLEQSFSELRKKGTILELPDVGRDGRRLGKIDPRIMNPEVQKEVDEFLQRLEANAHPEQQNVEKIGVDQSFIDGLSTISMAGCHHHAERSGLTLYAQMIKIQQALKEGKSILLYHYEGGTLDKRIKEVEEALKKQNQGKQHD